ncbi:MAG: peptidase M50, partial [Terriglobia bacterium]
LLPIYPLDGGQILRSLLWFMLGRGRSLMVAVVIGFAGVAGLFALAAWRQDYWLALISVFILMNCWTGLKQARALLKLAKLPRRPGFACHSCETAPPIGAFWKCNKCGQAFDTFQTRATCPHCAAQFSTTMCLDCRALNPTSKWMVSAVAPIE